MTVVVLGVGPLPFEPGRASAAGGERTWQFARAVAVEDLQVELLLLPSATSGEQRDDESGTVAHDGIRLTRLSREELESPLQLAERIARLDPACLIGATAYASFLLARANLDLPLWIDLFGDPMAEAQALAVRRNEDGPVENALWMSSWCWRNGDRFSVVSGRQRATTLGQLSGIGRLNRANAGCDLVHIVTPSVDPLPRVAQRRDSGRFSILCGGSFNSWTDETTLAAALELTLARSSSVAFVVTGGAIAGFLEGPWERFEAAVSPLRGRFGGRIDLLGWIEGEDLDRLEATAGAGVVAELPLLERELGIATRTLRWMARGLPVVSTALTELGAEIDRHELGLVYEPGDPESLAACLLKLDANRDLARLAGARARDWVADRFSVPATTGPLRGWAKEPRFAADRLDGSARALFLRQPRIVDDQLTLEVRAAASKRGTPESEG